MITQDQYNKRYNDNKTFMDSHRLIWSTDPELYELELFRYEQETESEPDTSDHAHLLHVFKTIDNNCKQCNHKSSKCAVLFAELQFLLTKELVCNDFTGIRSD
jgi:hypothetical protein